MLYLKKSFSLLQIKSHPIKGCLTPLTFTRSCSAMKSAKSFCGQNTWRTAVLTVRNRSCIPNSAITSSRMSRNDVLPCISIVNPANVIKDIRLLFEKKTSTIFSGNSFRRSRAVLWGSSFLVSTEGFLLEPILESPHDRGPAS